MLEHAALLRIGPEGMALGFEAGSFLGKQVQDQTAQNAIASALAAHFGGQPSVSFEALSSMNGHVTLAQLDGAERKAKLDLAKRAIVEHPLVVAAIELLGAELRDVRLSHEDALAAEHASVRR